MRDEDRAILNVVLTLFRIGITIYCVTRAKSLNRSQFGWGIFGFFLPLIALIWIQFVKPKKGNEDNMVEDGNRMVLDSHLAGRNIGHMNNRELKSRKYLVFDTETTGMPRNWNAPISDVNNWPRVVQLAWILVDSEGNEIDRKDRIIKPDGYSIPPDVTRIHGISTDRAIQEGAELPFVLDEFETALNKSDVVVAHNIDFDYKVLGSEFYRLKNRNPMDQYEQICTMKESTDYCAIPNRFGYKWPSLSELHRKIFGRSFEEAHNAVVDVEVCKNCFLELRNKGVILR